MTTSTNKRLLAVGRTNRTLSWTLAATSLVLGALVMLPLIRGARWVGLTFA